MNNWNVSKLEKMDIFSLGDFSLLCQVIYCYGDLVPRHGELFDGKEESGNRWILTFPF